MLKWRPFRPTLHDDVRVRLREKSLDAALASVRCLTKRALTLANTPDG